MSDDRLHETTEKLLVTVAALKWKGSRGKLAEAVDEWQLAGTPDLPHGMWCSECGSRLSGEERDEEEEF